MATRWNARTDSPIYTTRPEPRWDLEQLVVHLAVILGPWLLIIATLVYLTGWRPW
jgi:hypothetical protein